MIAVDTNILVRYITNDDTQQSLLVDKLFKKYLGKEKSIFINNIVLCELIWVLDRAYNYSKKQIIKTLKLIISSIEFQFENHQLIFLAITEFENINADFSDILIRLVNNSYDCTNTFSFDQKALKTKHFSSLDN